MIKVFLREKKLAHGKRGLYLDFYPPIIIDGKKTRREHLRLYIYEKPKSETEREHNKETKLLGEHIRSKRQLDLQAGSYGFLASRNKRRSFTEHLESLMSERQAKGDRGGYYALKALSKHLTAFRGETILFGDLTEDFCKAFKTHLENNTQLSKNTASNYFTNFKSIINKMVDDRLFADNPTRKVKGIEKQETQREFLTLEEIRRLAETPFERDSLRRAALFSALTGLRFSDIIKLIWGEIQHSESAGYFLRFRQQKTKGAETLPISDDAFSLLGERGANEEKVFGDLRKWQLKYYLPLWIKKAEIGREITFHAFRHSFATLQIALGTDIYTVSKMLGHRNMQTTQIYARAADKLKRDAANKITLK